MSDRDHDRPIKQLAICPKCGGYMRGQTAFTEEARRRGWQDDTRRRSFGGVSLRQFVCEKCHHTETFQLDELGAIDADD